MQLSIITINYNNLEGLRRTINSVMTQTWRNFEWIIVDGGSTDGSKELIEQTAANPNSNISWWCSEPDKGVYNAMNKGIGHAKGEYLNFMNSGDCFFEQNTLKLVFEGKEYNADVLYGDYGYLDRNFIKIEAPDSLSLDFIRDGNICHQAIFQKRDSLGTPYYDEQYKIYADWKKWRDSLILGFSFIHIPLVICICERGGISQTSKEKIQCDREKFLKSFPREVLNLINTNRKLKEQMNSYPVCKVIYHYNKGGFYKFVIKCALFFLDLISKIRK